MRLLIGADWACAHGDAGGLAHVLRQLAARVSAAQGSPLRAVCDAVARADDAFACWAAVRPAVIDALHDADDVDAGVESAAQRC